MTDTWVPRTADDFASAIESELPRGGAWPRDPDGDLMRWVDGCAQIFGNEVESAATLLLVTESDPSQTIALLPEWERAFGLPDLCNSEAQTIDARHKALINRIGAVGGQSRAYFISVAAALGYAITITEYRPFMCGLSRCGDTRPVAPADPSDTDYHWHIGPPSLRFFWKVHVLGSSTSWFRAGSGQCGVDPMVRIGYATDLECLFRRWKPAHTFVVFDYSIAQSNYVTYDWFRAGTGEVGVDPMLVIETHGGIADS